MKVKLFDAVMIFIPLSLLAWGFLMELNRPPIPARIDPEILREPTLPDQELDVQKHQMIAKAIKYLLRNQLQDGHWEGEGGKNPLTTTSVVGIAICMDRRPSPPDALMHPVESPHLEVLRKAADWLMTKTSAERHGLIYSEHPSESPRYMLAHGWATTFLAGAYNAERDPVRGEKLLAALQRSVRYIAQAQSTQGGWYDTSKAEGHDSDNIAATIVQQQALRATENAGVPFPSALRLDGYDYLTMAMGDPESPRRCERQDLAEIAGGLACRPDWATEPYEKWLSHCRAKLFVGGTTIFAGNELAHCYYAQAESKHGTKFRSEVWLAYQKCLIQYLRRHQREDGSWPAFDRMDRGSLYATALWCTILQLDKRNHPARFVDIFVRD